MNALVNFICSAFIYMAIFHFAKCNLCVLASDQSTSFNTSQLKSDHNKELGECIQDVSKEKTIIMDLWYHGFHAPKCF